MCEKIFDGEGAVDIIAWSYALLVCGSATARAEEVHGVIWGGRMAARVAANVAAAESDAESDAWYHLEEGRVVS